MSSRALAHTFRKCPDCSHPFAPINKSTTVPANDILLTQQQIEKQKKLK
jgi:hypothetical protein